MKWVLIFWLMGFAASAQTDYVLEGTLGKATIYLQFTDDPSEKNRIDDIRYFYKNSLKDITLEGSFEKGHYIFWFQNEHFALLKNKDGSFSGTWKNNKSKSLPVLLRPLVAQSRPKENDADSDNPLGQIKQSLIGFRKDSTTVFNGKKIDWYSETHSVTPMIRLADGYPKNRLDSINAVLEKMHRGLALEQLDCASRFSYSKGKNIEFDIELGYLDNNLLGFDLFSYYDCGGAHPSGGSEGILIDLHNGKSYDIDDILAFDASVVRSEINNFDQFSTYRHDYFAPKLYALLDREYHFKKPTTAEQEDECDYTDLDTWTFASWRFTTKGIVFLPSFPHMSQNCIEPFLLSFDVLRVYKNPAFPYRF